MGQSQWTLVDQYYADLLLREDEGLDWILEANSAAGLPPIDVTPLQGKLLDLLLRISAARRILEIGTLGGYSTAWMARAIPDDGMIVSLELDPGHAKAAADNLARAKLAQKVDLRVGRALDSLKQMVRNREQFDFVFVDADKPSNPVYFEQVLQLTRAGSIIVFDNVVRDGAVVESCSADPNVLGIRALNELIADCDRVDATAIQTVGGKGYDGFTILLVAN